jgi:hypothetical protein
VTAKAPTDAPAGPKPTPPPAPPPKSRRFDEDAFVALNEANDRIHHTARMLREVINERDALLAKNVEAHAELVTLRAALADKPGAGLVVVALGALPVGAEFLWRPGDDTPKTVLGHNGSKTEFLWRHDDGQQGRGSCVSTDEVLSSAPADAQPAQMTEGANFTQAQIDYVSAMIDAAASKLCLGVNKNGSLFLARRRSLGVVDMIDAIGADRIVSAAIAKADDR